MDGGLTLLVLAIAAAGFAAIAVFAGRRMFRDNAAARQRAELLAAALDHLRDGAAVFGADQRLMAWNERFFTASGLPTSLAKTGASMDRFADAAGDRIEIHRFDLPHGGKLLTAVEKLEPLAGAAEQAARPRATMVAQRDAPMVKTGKRAVLVEDDAMVRLITADLLAELGYEVVGHATGGAALLSLAVDHADLLVTDIGLPDMSGLDVARHAVQLSPDIAVIVASGAHDDGEGGFTFLEKPYDVARLRRAVERATKAVA